MKQAGIFAVLAVIACSWPSRLHAQSDPALAIHTEAGRSTFHIGERIALELGFTSSSANRYEINLASFDRSGRMRFEQFEVSPKRGRTDPLAAYFADGYVGGGISSSQALSERPAVISLDLNEWVRFDQPGDYEVRVTSSRVSVPGKAVVQVPSEPLKLHIIPATAEWQEQRLHEGLEILRTVPASQGDPSKARKGAIADIRYLRSKAAIQVMTEGLREDRPDALYSFAFGLIGLPKDLRGEAIRAMQDRYDDPAFPISGWFLRVEAQLLNTSDHGMTAEESSHFRELAWRQGLASLSHKRGQALALSSETLLSQPPPGDLSASEKNQLASVLSRTFSELPPERQTSVLLYQWDFLRSDSLEPTLRRLAQLPLDDPANNLSTTYARRELKAAALSRWYELNPEEATRVALQEVGSASPSLTEKDLAFLPDQKMPQFETVWAAALLQETSFTRETALTGLLARFGTGSSLPSVIEKLNKNVGQWACAPQGAALAYVVEFDPDQARGLLKRAVIARGPGHSACNHSVFQNVAVYASAPVLTDIAIEAIQDPDPQVANDALSYLMHYGDQRAQKPIWERYFQWIEAWRSKESELEARKPGDMVGNWEQRGLGENLATALIANQGWLASKELILQVLDRCVGEQMCATLKRLAASATPPYQVRLYRLGRQENDTVAQYTEKSEALLQAKIAQFPRGTTFFLVSDPAPSRTQRVLEDHARTFFERAGMTLKAEH